MFTDHNGDTIFAPATIPGTGAISIIRISGPNAIRTAAAIVRPAALPSMDNPEVLESGGMREMSQMKTESEEGKSSTADILTNGQDAGTTAQNGTGTDDNSRCDCTREALNQRIMSSKGYRIHFGRIAGPDNKILDEVLVSVFRSPHSYTGEDSVEISCHASSYIVSEISSLLVRHGLRPAGPGEFTRRAFLNGKMDLTQAEAVADVISAQSAAAHRVAISQMKGGFSLELKSMRDKLLEIVSLMELELDFSDEEVEFADRSRLDSLVNDVLSHIHRLTDSFRLGNAIRNGIPVAIVGATNVGKSTLLNALLGEDRAIVSDIHGTTRDTIEETLNIDGILFRFIDTAGLRETTETVERIGIERSYRKLHDARIVLGIVDATRPYEEIRKDLSEILANVDPTSQDIFIVINKCDAVSKSDYESGHPYPKDSSGRGCKFIYNKNVIDINKIVSSIDNKNIIVIPISAKEEMGLDALKSSLASSQKDILANSDAVLVTNIRHFEALSSAAAALGRVRSGLKAGVPTDLISQDIREALYHLGSILGEISTDEILGNIFRNFCIGK